MKSSKRICSSALSLIIALSLIFSSSVGLLMSSSAASKLDDAKSSYSDAKKEYDALKKKKASAQDQLAAAQKAYFALVKQVDILNGSISKVQKQIDKLEQQIMQYEVKIQKEQTLMDSKYNAFCKRLKAIYISGSMSSLQVLMTCDDFSDYLTRLEMVTKVADRDSAAIEELLDILHDLQKMQERLDSDRGQQEAKKSALVTQKNELNEKKAQASQSLSECESLMQTIQSAQANAASEMKKALAEINKLTASGGIKGTGQLCYPVPSCTTVSCGYYGYSNHNGVDFANGPGLYGATVVASDDGQVVGADYWTYSYGYHVTIDHGNGIKTIYCHMSAISVRVGQNVKKGQAIGAVGCSGHVVPSGRGGTHLHFGVIANGSFVNPFNYL